MAPSIHQLHPLQVNPETGEVFLQLPAPYEDIIITPPRLSDAAAAVKIHNDPRVYKTLQGPPYPYTQENAQAWITLVKQGSDEILAELERASEVENGAGASHRVVVAGCPVRHIRSIKDGQDVFLGDIGVDRLRSRPHDAAAEEEFIEINAARETGDPDIIWEIGDYLNPEFHGKGIMTAGVRAVIQQWAVPRMNAHHIVATAFTGNVGSVRVFEKCGFKHKATVPDCVQIVESKGGGRVGLHFLEWTRLDTPAAVVATDPRPNAGFHPIKTQQLHPLQMNQVTGEVFLQLPAPYEDIIITPPRMSDTPAILKILNDPRVNNPLLGTPRPYTEEHARKWLEKCLKTTDDVLGELRKASEDGVKAPVSVAGCPVRHIRSTKDGQDVYLGDVGIVRLKSRLHYLNDSKKEEEIIIENSALASGDPAIIWEIGDYLHPEFHGRGIMTAVVRALIEQWAIPRMNARRIFATAGAGNAASVRVFEKCGFKLKATVVDCVQIAENKGGGKLGLHFLEWVHPDATIDGEEKQDAISVASLLGVQLRPLKIDRERNEVYLQLPEPHQDIIITPPRKDDVASIVKILNDPRVYKLLDGPPYPYLPSHAEWWLGNVDKKCYESLLQLKKSSDEGKITPVIVDGCPVRIIRKVLPDGTQRYLGDVGIDRQGRFDFLYDRDKEAEMVKKNQDREIGDPEIIWEFGDYLDADFHGQGIMTAAIRAVIQEWAVPRMNARKIWGLAFEGNIGSVRVFEKNGMKMLTTVKNCVIIPESKGGGKIGMHFLEGVYPDP